MDPVKAPRPTCRCGKAVFRSEGEAEHARRWQQKQRKAGGSRLVIYRCLIKPEHVHIGHVRES